MHPPHSISNSIVISYLGDCQYGSGWFLSEWRVRFNLPSYGRIEAVIDRPTAWEPRSSPSKYTNPHHESLAEDAYYYGILNDEQPATSGNLIEQFRAADFATSAYRGSIENHDHRLRPFCSIEDVRGGDGWIVTFVVAHPPERCRCFHGTEAA
jgi:hypothetical protein